MTIINRCNEYKKPFSHCLPRRSKSHQGHKILIKRPCIPRIKRLNEKYSNKQRTDCKSSYLFSYRINCLLLIPLNNILYAEKKIKFNCHKHYPKSQRINVWEIDNIKYVFSQFKEFIKHWWKFHEYIPARFSLMLAEEIFEVV